MIDVPSSDPALSIIVPAFNEARRLPDSLKVIRQFVAQRKQSCELIIVDDGSADDTADLAEQFDMPFAKQVIRLPQNQGKGAAVKAGMLAARGELRLFSDADLSTPLDEVDKLIRAIQGGADVAIASRDLPGSVLDPPQPLRRRIVSRLFKALRQTMLLPRINDTQCGFKLFTRHAAEQIFPLLETPGFAFDLEVLGIADHFNLHIAEVPVRWADNTDSRVRMFRDGWRSVVAIWHIRRRVDRLLHVAEQSESPDDAA